MVFQIRKLRCTSYKDFSNTITNILVYFPDIFSVDTLCEYVNNIVWEKSSLGTQIKKGKRKSRLCICNAIKFLSFPKMPTFSCITAFKVFEESFKNWLWQEFLPNNNCFAIKFWNLELNSDVHCNFKSNFTLKSSKMHNPWKLFNLTWN